jgi:hypothetical protein
VEGQLGHRMADVFGISRDVPANYVPRNEVDGKSIDSRDKHVVVFGSSKEGKARRQPMTSCEHGAGRSAVVC